MTVPAAAAASDAAVWSRLWGSGVLHSCATGIDGNYDGAIRAYWESAFARVPDGGRVVDIGTGNGAVLLLAREVAARRSHTLQLHGVDVADIDPMRAVPDGASRFSGVVFHPQTSATALPFGDGDVALVCSQFGVEYAPRDAAIDEILRVIGPGGRAAFILHSDDSIVADVSRQQREACVFLLEHCPVFERARALVPVLARAALPHAREALARDAAADVARTAFNEAAQQLMDQIAARPLAVVLQNAAQQVRQVLQLAGTSEAMATQALDRALAGLQDEFVRLQQLQAALIGADELERIAERFRQHGFTARSAPIEQRPGIKMGWTLDVVP